MRKSALSCWTDKYFFDELRTLLKVAMYLWQREQSRSFCLYKSFGMFPTERSFLFFNVYSLSKEASRAHICLWIQRSDSYTTLWRSNLRLITRLHAHMRTIVDWEQTYRTSDQWIQRGICNLRHHHCLRVNTSWSGILYTLLNLCLICTFLRTNRKEEWNKQVGMLRTKMYAWETSRMCKRAECAIFSPLFILLYDLQYTCMCSYVCICIYMFIPVYIYVRACAILFGCIYPWIYGSWG